jgi:adenylate cyclase
MLDSSDFVASERNRRFLRYVVDETLAGRADRLKGYTVAVQVFGRDPAFDAQTHPLVRIEAARLRQSLERYYLKAGQADPVRISIPKGGYVPVFEQLAPAATDPALRNEAEPHFSPPHNAIERPSNRPRGWIAAGAAAVTIAILAIIWIVELFQSQGTSSQTSHAGGFGPTLLIRPFTNIKGGAPEDRFSQGLAEELTVELARFKTMRIITEAPPASRRTSSDGYDYVLKGSVRNTGSILRVVVQLEEVRSGILLWTRSFDLPENRSDFIEIQSDIAARVATVLGDPYDVLFANEANRIRSMPSGLTGPYACVVSFYSYWPNPTATQHRILKICHERAVAAEPLFAEAWINLAWLRLDEYRFGFNPAESAAPPLDRAAEAAESAIALQPDNARAQLALAIVQWFRHDRHKFDEHADLALSLNDNDPMIEAELGLRFALRGEWWRARPLLDKVVSRDPIRWQAYRVAYALNAVQTGDYRSALDELRRARTTDRPVLKVLRAAVCGHLGRLEEAREQWRSAAQQVPDIADAPRSWIESRGASPDLTDRLMDGLDKAGVLGDR